MRPRKVSPPPSLYRDPDTPTQIWVGSEPPQQILCFSNLARFRWWLSLARTDYEAPQHIAAIAHGGQPLRRDIQLLKLLREPAGAIVTVFGDLDPDDLLLYATLSAALDPPGREARRSPVVEYSGVTSRRLLALAERVFGWDSVQASTEPFDQREAALMRFIRQKSLIDFERLLGAKATAILESGRRLEIEALVPPLLEDPKSRKTLINWLRPPRRA